MLMKVIKQEWEHTFQCRPIDPADRQLVNIVTGQDRDFFRIGTDSFEIVENAEE
jgi:hypothetical protein